MELNKEQLQATLDISVKTSKTIDGYDDPNFIRIHHNNHHIVLYIKDYIMKENCKTYFEIGTHFGHSLCNLLQSEYPTKFASCDMFAKGSTIANDCKYNDIESLAKGNAKKFNTNNYEYKIFKGNSHSQQMLEKVKETFPEGIDLLFIDGDHRRAAVMADFEMYFPLVNSGGFIVFDDYLPYVWNGTKRQCPDAINDLVKKFENQLEVIGLVNDIVGANKLKGLNESQNCDFIVKKK